MAIEACRLFRRALPSRGPRLCLAEIAAYMADSVYLMSAET